MKMEPHPPAAVPEPPLPRGPRRDGTEPEPELEPDLDLDLWVAEAAEPAPGPPPWSPPEQGGCLALGVPAEPPSRPEEEEEEPRLRPVFDALDRDGDGFVRVEEFVQFATAYGAEQVRPATRPGPAAGTAPGPCQAGASPRTWLALGSGSPRGRDPRALVVRRWLPAVGHRGRCNPPGSLRPALWWSPAKVPGGRWRWQQPRRSF